MIWDQLTSVNFSCGGGGRFCDAMWDLGPPPDIILALPPPPVPPHLGELVARLSAEALQPEGPGFDSRSAAEGFEQSCELCHWATGNNIGFVELAQKGATKSYYF